MHPILHWPLLIDDSYTHIETPWGYAMATPSGNHDGFGDGLRPGTGYGESGDDTGNGIGIPREYFASRGFL